MNQELLDEWEEISKRYGFDKQQVYIEDLHRQNTPQQDLLDLISKTERTTGDQGEDILYALDLERKYLKPFRLVENPEIYAQCTSSNCYPRKNYKFNFFGFDSNDYEEDMLLMKGLVPAKSTAHLDIDEELDYSIDISDLNNMLKGQVS